ncbi:MAG TPA: DoxX family protein, partial [Noviherbaspirillum sp.]|nr:DoxX family protein [Noviherbaspirillum sp.]
MPLLAPSRTSDDLGKLLLRVTLAFLILLHGIAKVLNGVDPIMGMLARQGFPPALAYLVYLGEVIAPVLIIIGIWTRPAALIIAINMVVAVWLVHMRE